MISFVFQAKRAASKVGVFSMNDYSERLVSSKQVILIEFCCRFQPIDLLKSIVEKDPPQLSLQYFTAEFANFVSQW